MFEVLVVMKGVGLCMLLNVCVLRMIVNMR